MNSDIIIAPTGNIMLEAQKSRASNIVIPNTFIPDRLPRDKELIALNKNSGRSTSIHAFFRFILNLSSKNFIVTSAIDIVDGRAAINSNKKNNADQNSLNSICAKTSGRVMNTRVVPSRSLSIKPNDVTAGNIITPISIATNKSNVDTVTAVLVNFVSLGKYEE